MKDLEQRFRVFIEKLTERAESLAEETRGAIQEIYDEDADPYKRSFGNFLMGVKGQFKGIIDKADKTSCTFVFENSNARRRASGTMV